MCNRCGRVESAADRNRPKRFICECREVRGDRYHHGRDEVRGDRYCPGRDEVRGRRYCGCGRCHHHNNRRGRRFECRCQRR